jgi:hypothetical protein
MALKIHGVYDNQTVSHLKDLGIDRFCFDFRPKSFNFIPQATCIEIIQQQLDRTDQVSLFFDQDNPLVMKEIFKNISQAWSERFALPAEGQVSFDLSYPYDLKTLNDLGGAFKMYFSGHEQLVTIQRSQWFRGIFLQYPDLIQLQQQGKLSSFRKELKDLLQYVSRPYEIDIVFDWNQSIEPHILRTFPEAQWTLPINQDIEMNYRTVDLHSMEHQLKKLKFLYV